MKQIKSSARLALSPALVLHNGTTIRVLAALAALSEMQRALLSARANPRILKETFSFYSYSFCTVWTPLSVQ